MTAIVQISSLSIQDAAAFLKQGYLVAIPTETVYGMSAIATSATAVADIYGLKKRPVFNPLISHVSSLEEAQRYGDFSPLAVKLAQAFWPGPLTLVVTHKSASSLCDLVTAGLATVALRVPAHDLVRQLIQAVGVPLAAPSANPSESISPTSAHHVAAAFKGDPRLAMILDGGFCAIGIESTILDVSGNQPVLLRPGGVTVEAIEALVGPILTETNPDILKAPGQMKRHYAPQKSLRLNVVDPETQEGMLLFGPQTRSYDFSLNLSPKGNLSEAACNLFHMLRTLDQGSALSLGVQPIPNHGLGFAINDRLTRAAYRPEP